MADPSTPSGTSFRSGTSDLMIASDPAALTPAWVTGALRAGGALDAGVSVTAVATSPIGTGQMCDSLRLELTYDGAAGAPPTVVAKLPAADETSRSTAKALRNYELEVRFYQQLAPGLDVRTPHCLYADIDVEAADFVLLLEDMAPARAGDQLTGCTPDQAALAVAELPKLHAPRWDDPGLAGIEWLHGDPAARQTFLAELLPALHLGFRDRYGERLDDDVTTALDALFGHLGDHLAARQGPTTIVHGDYRLDNLLFGGGGGGAPVAVVDWQTVSTGPAMGDVAYFIGAGLVAEDRRAHEHDLVVDYLDRLRGAGVHGYQFDDAWDDYRRGTWSGLVMAVAASMLVERTDRGDEMFLTMAHRHARHAIDLEAAALLAP